MTAEGPYLPFPPVASLGFVDLVVVYARVAAPHVPVFVELPVLIAVTAPPLTVLVVRLVLETHRDAVALVAPQLLDQPVVELPSPLAFQEGDYLLTTPEELVAVAPLGVFGVGLRDLFGVAGIPGVLGGLYLLAGGLLIERRDRWSRHGSPPANNAVFNTRYHCTNVRFRDQILYTRLA